VTLPSSQQSDPVGRSIVDVRRIDLATTLRTVAFLPLDPTVRLAPGRFERATITPDGPGSIRVTWARQAGTDNDTDNDTVAHVETFGDGAAWLLERAERLLGVTDDVTGFEPTERPLRDLWRRHRGDRIPATGTLWHDVAWFIVQQRIDTTSAAEQWRRLVSDMGAPAPGIDGLMVPPEPEAVARLGYHHFHRYGIERQRAEHLRNAARAARRLQALVDEGVEAEEAMPVLQSVPGIGPWTATCLAVQTWGNADTVVLGDDGIPSMVAWLVAGERRADDARMLELLEPFRPHRHRLVRLGYAGDVKPPRRAPRARRDDIRRR